ncbi:hypothetical protein BCV72DRAFT_55662 [Rhizopus microsporus var. microsporus]|uniref:Uncharacterized protein n=1 Tax=Rhizopus microsporus var. microsporus TaxID=86635 RepID=A0A1X0RCP6_RHIZD|nr:hypothetical protein BCV72DRAFT_55662 [Rhizopus microsporus var. microsporus]
MTDTTAGAASEDRVWNRNVAAVLNFWHILYGLRENQKRPERFLRSNNTARLAGSK